MRFSILLLLAAVLAAGETALPLPKTWVGKKDGTLEGNPALVQGVPLWRLDRIFGKIEEGKTWEPLPWSADKGRWYTPKKTMAGAPFASIDGGVLSLQTRSAYDGGGDNEADKIIALVFIAPADAKYAVVGSLETDKFEGQGKQFLFIVRRDGAKENKRVAELKKLELPGGKATTALKEGPFPLDANQELCLVVRNDYRQSATTVNFRKFNVVAVP